MPWTVLQSAVLSLALGLFEGCTTKTVARQGCENSTPVAIPSPNGSHVLVESYALCGLDFAPYGSDLVYILDAAEYERMLQSEKRKEVLDLNDASVVVVFSSSYDAGSSVAWNSEDEVALLQRPGLGILFKQPSKYGIKLKFSHPDGGQVTAL